MSRLFIELYLDEDVEVVVADMIRAAGFSARTTRDEGRLSDPDDKQLAFAAARGWTVLTHNRVHFQALADDFLASGRSHAGMILAFRKPTRELADKVLLVLNTLTADEMRDNVVYL